MMSRTLFSRQSAEGPLLADLDRSLYGGSRLRAPQITALCAFGIHEQTRIATAVSELARDAFAYTGGGRVRFFVGKLVERQSLIVFIDDLGEATEALDPILGDDTEQHSLKGSGLLAARRLMDRCDVVTGSQVTKASNSAISSHARPGT